MKSEVASLNFFTIGMIVDAIVYCIQSKPVYFPFDAIPERA